MVLIDVNVHFFYSKSLMSFHKKHAFVNCIETVKDVTKINWYKNIGYRGKLLALCFFFIQSKSVEVSLL